jgi:ATP-dependent helicase/nuclease subunit A
MRVLSAPGQMSLDTWVGGSSEAWAGESPEAEALRALTPEQEQAVARRSGPLLLSAAAGSGKTAVLVERFVRAVREDGVAPGRILAITFTERAAGELRARVRARLLELGEREAARDTEGAPIGTFHGFCARLLRGHALHAGVDPEFAVLDEAAAGRLELLAFRRALASLLDEARPGPEREQAVDLVAAYGADRMRAMLLRVYAEQRSRGMAAPALPQAALEERDEAALRACALLDEALRSFGREYSELKRARGALDFDDLELCARELLAEHGDVRASWSQRLELLMVDEFQDTNRRQLSLLELLDRGNLFTVGDELQSIYGFRHADVEIFRERRAALDRRGAVLALARNFRARPALVEAVNAVFAARFGADYTLLVAAREDADGGGEVVARRGPGAARPREDGGALEDAGERGVGVLQEDPAAHAHACAADRPKAPALELLLTDRRGWEGSPHAQGIADELPPAPLWRQAEARLLAQRIAEILGAGEAAARDIVVLLRAAGDLPVYERALQDHGVSTLATVGTFWGHQQVADLLAWLRALANPLDELALYGTLASALVGLSSDALALLALHARAHGTGLWATIEGGDGELRASLSGDDRERLRRFARTFEQERRLAPAHGIAELLLRAISASGYERHVRSLSSGERRLANIHKLLRLARRFEAAEGRGLRAFLDHVAHRGVLAQGEPQAPAGGAEPDAVRLMTIHAAKGLEFGVVCLADLGRAGNSQPPDLLLDGERIGLRLASLDGSETRACLHYEELYEERRRAEQAEEERIVYVAMTRARERLLLSGAVDFARWPAERPGGPPIAWLAPALCAEISQHARTLERAVLDVSVGAARMRCRLSAPATVEEVLDMAGRSSGRGPLTARAAMLVT